VFGRDLGNGDSITAVLDILESRGLARVLAEPSLVAMSGQTATFLAGGEFPVPVSQGGAVAGGISVEYKEFGVRLSLSPTVLARDRIALKIAPEVSDLDFSAGIQIGGVSVPALKVRRTDTTVELGDGETFLISGLVSSNLISSIDKLPGLGDIPILGALFKSSNLEREDRELIMVVTPRLVRPMAKEARLPKMPGAEYDRYDPSWGRTILLENGDFDAGFSR
jgi:pilus assembly protein CpaC